MCGKKLLVHHRCKTLHKNRKIPCESWGSCAFNVLSNSVSGQKITKKLQYYIANVKSGCSWASLAVQLLTCMADSKRYLMSPKKAASMWSCIDDWMDSELCWWVVEGAKISILRWSRSHQIGVELLSWCGVAYAVVIVRRMDACRFTNADLLCSLRKWCHVILKSGPLWSYTVLMNDMPCSQWLRIVGWENRCVRLVVIWNGLVGEVIDCSYFVGIPGCGECSVLIFGIVGCLVCWVLEDGCEALLCIRRAHMLCTSVVRGSLFCVLG
jgi:hypothetical protein